MRIVSDVGWPEQNNCRGVQSAGDVHKPGISVDVELRIFQDPCCFVQRRSLYQVDVDSGDVATFSRPDLNDPEIGVRRFQSPDQCLPVFNRPALRCRAGRYGDGIVEAIMHCYVPLSAAADLRTEKGIRCRIWSEEQVGVAVYIETSEISDTVENVPPCANRDSAPQTIE
jgi:hypothetical protein